jgi:methyl-accepting chemotaxis protein
MEPDKSGDVRRTMKFGKSTTGTPAGADAELVHYRTLVADMMVTLRGLHQGNLEARLGPLPEAAPADLRELRSAFNDFTDVNDAFVRESAAALTAASQGEYYREFLVRGLHGAYSDAAGSINRAREKMRDNAEELARDHAERAALAERVQEVAEHVAAAATELGASSDTLASSAQEAVSRADAARRTVQSLEESSSQIRDAVELIKRIAAQTRLLALNATIEAAHAAEGGRGFAVVASEVKTLAEEVNRSSDDISAQVAQAQAAADQAASAINNISEVIAEMDLQVAGVAQAAGGGAGDQQGLSHLAEVLRSETIRLAGG